MLWKAARLPLVIMVLFTVGSVAQSQGPVKVRIEDDRAEVFEPVLPVENFKRVQLQCQPNLALQIRVDNKTMHLGYIYTIFKVDGRVTGSTQTQFFNRPLPKSAGGKDRDGFMALCQIDKVHVTQTAEIVPTRATGGKRKLDAVLVRYTLENKDNVSRQVAVRVGMDMYLVDNDGALFAAPTIPGRVLDGVELKGKTLPDYLQVLQRPDLKNPMWTAHFTYALGGGLERPSRIVLTGLRAGAVDGWTLQALAANGDSAMSMYWDVKELKPNSKREIAYAYGQGIASSVESEGNVRVSLGGSFEPGKLFTIAALVDDPAPGQALTLRLPMGLELVEGKEVQPVPNGSEDSGSLVLWKARVARPGQYRLGIQSSTGVTQTKIITITSH